MLAVKVDFVTLWGQSINWGQLLPVPPVYSCPNVHCVRLLQLTEYNAQCLENSQKQNQQIEQLSRQLAESHNQQQQLLQRLQQLQHQSRYDDIKQHQQLSSSTPPVLVNGDVHQSTSQADAEADQVSTLCRMQAYQYTDTHISCSGSV